MSAVDEFFGFGGTAAGLPVVRPASPSLSPLDCDEVQTGQTEPQRVALRAERDLIERRQYADLLRLREIRGELVRLGGDDRMDG